MDDDAAAMGSRFVRGCATALAIAYVLVAMSCTPTRFQRVLTETAGRGASVQTTADAGYIVAGMVDSNPASGLDPFFALRTEGDGTPLWSGPLGSGYAGWASDVVVSPDGGFAVCGTVMFDLASGQMFLGLTHIGEAGAVVWSRIFPASARGSTQSGQCQDLSVTRDGGYVLVWKMSAPPAGETAEVWILATDSQGIERWRHPLEGTAGPAAAQTTEEGGSIVAMTNSIHPAVTLIKLDADGNETWSRTYAQTAGISISIGSVAVTSTGGYFVASPVVNPITHVTSAVLLATDALGNFEWMSEPPELDGDIVLSDGVQAADGGFVAVGARFDVSRCLLLKTDSAGQSVWSREFGDESWAQWCTSVRATPDGGFVFTGQHAPGGLYLVKTDASGDAGPPPG